MARHSQPKYALGLLLQAVRPSLSSHSKTHRDFVKDFFDQVCEDALVPKPLPDDEGGANTVRGGWLRGVDVRDLNKFWNGTRRLPEAVAARILPAIREEKVIALWGENSTKDAITVLAKQLHKEGVAIKKPIDVPKAVFSLLYAVVEANAAGSDLLKDAASQKKVQIPGVKSYDLRTGRIVGNKIMIDSSQVEISPAPPVPEVPEPDEKYLDRALEAIADNLHCQVVPFERLEELPFPFPDFMVRQRTNYWSAVGRRRNLQEIRPDDGDQHFEQIKDDLNTQLMTTWMSRSFPDGYERMVNTLKQAGSYVVAGSVLTNIEGLFGSQEKQGLTHMLVNDNKVRWLLS